MAQSVPVLHLAALFSLLFIAGMALTLPLYKFDYRRFVRSSVFIKILLWIPIFALFLMTLYASATYKAAILAVLIIWTVLEFVRVFARSKAKRVVALYFVLFTAGLLYFVLVYRSYNVQFIGLLVALCFSTVMSDVMAYFFGNYLGKHKLPKQLNDSKSWEGVFGQLVGALVGVMLVNAFILPVDTLWLFLPIGIGCALGDLVNSYAKRKTSIKDWSHAIPGHGGLIDRLSSMAGSTVLMYYFLNITS